MILPNELRGAENKLIRGVGVGWKGTPMERFWRKAAFDPVSGCVLWIGSKTSSGYGNFYCGREKRVRPAHRWLWEQYEGSLPTATRLELDHLCRNPACVNLLHLEVVTPSENQLRGINPALTRARAAAKTHCAKGHPYDDANTRIERDGTRRCRMCAKLYARFWRERKAIQCLAS